MFPSDDWKSPSVVPASNFLERLVIDPLGNDEQSGVRPTNPIRAICKGKSHGFRLVQDGEGGGAWSSGCIPKPKSFPVLCIRPFQNSLNRLGIR